MLKQNHTWNILVNSNVILLIIWGLMGCQGIRGYKLENESALAVVIKYNSASELLLYDEAEKYIDINSTFGEFTEQGKSAHDIWKEYLRFNYNLGNTKKFSNRINYHKYSIVEEFNDSEAKVTFKEINGKKLIIYTLSLIENGWIIIDINYEGLSQ